MTTNARRYSPVRYGVAALALLAICLLADPVWAQNCTVQVTADVQFGSYDPLAVGNLDTTSSLRVSCTGSGGNVAVKINEGSSGTFWPRSMFQGAEQLDYNLYLDATHTTVWGDGSGSTSFATQVFPPGNRTADFTVYARAPLGQDVSAGVFADTVTVIIEF